MTAALRGGRRRTAQVAWTVLGEGEPVTVAAHGLGGSAAETRPLVRRVPGTRVLLDFRGHGASGPLPGGWDYDLLVEDVLAVADEVGATRALGLSLGAGALLRAAARHPSRFDRLALVLPAAVAAGRADGAVQRLEHLGAAITRRDAGAVQRLLLDDVPPAERSRRAVRLVVARRAEELVRRPAPVPLGDDRPLGSEEALNEVQAHVLVVGQADDPLHPLDLARDLAAALPRGALLPVGPAGVFWTEARRVQDALAAFLGGQAAGPVSPPPPSDPPRGDHRP